MQILLVAATTFEIQPAIDFLQQPGARPPGLEIKVLVTGVGSLATAWSLVRQIDSCRPDLVIQAGIAGCFTHLPAGKVVVVGEEMMADQGVWEDHRFKSIFDMKLADPDAAPFSAGLLVNPHKELMALTGLEVVRGITVNEITTDPVRIGWYQQNTAPVVESMEGAGLHYVCLRESVTFVQFRSVSNDVGVRDKTRWNITEAIGSLNDQVISFLKKL